MVNRGDKMLYPKFSVGEKGRKEEQNKRDQKNSQLYHSYIKCKLARPIKRQRLSS